MFMDRPARTGRGLTGWSMLCRQVELDTEPSAAGSEWWKGWEKAPNLLKILPLLHATWPTSSAAIK